jgi:hypothetical protein
MSLALLITSVEELVETKTSWRAIVGRASRQLGMSIGAAILLLPVCGRVLGWVID